MARIIVSGTRRQLTPEETQLVITSVVRTIESLHETPLDIVGLGVGDCPTGVDSVVWGTFIIDEAFKADWAKHGRKAGPIRNREMVAWAAEEEGSVLLAFPQRDFRKSPGTINAVQAAITAGLRIVVQPL